MFIDCRKYSPVSLSKSSISQNASSILAIFSHDYPQPSAIHALFIIFLPKCIPQQSLIPSEIYSYFSPSPSTGAIWRHFREAAFYIIAPRARLPLELRNLASDSPKQRIYTYHTIYLYINSTHRWTGRVHRLHARHTHGTQSDCNALLLSMCPRPARPGGVGYSARRVNRITIPPRGTSSTSACCWLLCEKVRETELLHTRVKKSTRGVNGVLEIRRAVSFSDVAARLISSIIVY